MRSRLSRFFRGRVAAPADQAAVPTEIPSRLDRMVVRSRKAAAVPGQQQHKKIERIFMLPTDSGSR